ncbi:MAG: hypothetical protein ACT4R6_12550, partial [Gemmatimonadaceae bacterium]
VLPEQKLDHQPDGPVGATSSRVSGISAKLCHIPIGAQDSSLTPPPEREDFSALESSQEPAWSN